MPQRPDPLASDVHVAHVKELQLLQRPVVDLLDDLPRVRSLNLEPPQAPGDSVPVRAGRRPVVLDDFHVVSPGPRLILQPVGRRTTADEHELVLGLAEQDPVADDMAVGSRRYILLGPVDREVRRAVDGRVGDQLQRVRALNEQIHHMVGLVEQDGRLAPGTLLAPPVGELGRHDRVDVRADL